MTMLKLYSFVTLTGILMGGLVIESAVRSLG
jgi:hypothetical protein